MHPLTQADLWSREPFRIAGVGRLTEEIDADESVPEEAVDPWPSEERDLAGGMKFRQTRADRLGHGQDSVDCVSENVLQCIGIDPTELEAERRRLEHLILDRRQARSAHDIGVAGAVDHGLAAVGCAPGLVLNDDVGDSPTVDDDVGEPRVEKHRHPTFDQHLLGGKLHDLIVYRPVAAIAFKLGSAELGRTAHQFKGDPSDMLFASDAEFTDRSDESTGRHSAYESVTLNQQCTGATSCSCNGCNDSGRSSSHDNGVELPEDRSRPWCLHHIRRIFLIRHALFGLRCPVLSNIPPGSGPTRTVSVSDTRFVCWCLSILIY